jgi:uncharacterized protein YbjT (DUF2867 family)
MDGAVDERRFATDVLHDVDLSAGRPIGSGEARSEHPERRPDPLAKRQPDACLDPAEVLKGASVVVDVSNSPSWEDAAVLKFFETSEAAAGVGHHVALSVVGTDRLSESGYFRAKIAQEKLIKESSNPYSIVHATQFFEFLKGLADISFDGDKVHLPPVLFQPMAADDVASGVGRIAVGPSVNGIVEIGGRNSFAWMNLLLEEMLSHVLPEP